MKILLSTLLIAVSLGGCAVVPAPYYVQGGPVVVGPSVAVVPPPVVIRPWGYGGYGSYGYGGYSGYGGYGGYGYRGYGHRRW